MAQDRTVHTKRFGQTRYRDLQVYYDKGGINYWDYSRKPKGIYFASHCYRRSGGCKTWSTGQKGDGYICVIELERYKPTALRAVCQRVEQEAEAIHALLDGRGGSIIELTAFLRGKGDLPRAALQEAA